MIAPGNHWDSNSLRGAPPLQVREGIRSFGRYEFAGADTAVEGFPHINDVYHNISLGVPERYRAQNGVTIIANKGARLSAGIACKQQFTGRVSRTDQHIMIEYGTIIFPKTQGEIDTVGKLAYNSSKELTR